MTKDEVALLRQDIKDLINQILLRTEGLPEENGTGDVEYLQNVRAVLLTLDEKEDIEDEYMDSYYDSGCMDY